MNYISITKCTFISDTHVIFDFEIYREIDKETKKNNTVGEGNIVISKKLIYNYDTKIVLDKTSEDSISQIKIAIRNAIEKCIKRASAIFAEKDAETEN